MGRQSLTTCGMRQMNFDRACLAGVSLVVGTPLPTQTCNALCPPVSGIAFQCSVASVDVPPGTVTLNCPGPFCVGRRPSGLAEREPSGHDLADYLSEAARLEAASIEAFRILRHELHAHGAPRKLLRAASRAARDEVRHARTTRGLARRFGGTSTDPVVATRKPRSLEAIATENAVEGCVRETYGALVATFQARTARNALVRAAMTRIAKDETRHAALAWKIAAWLEPRLTTEQKRRIAAAREAAVQEIAQTLESPTPKWVGEVGLPAREQALNLFAQASRTIWS
jgi:hypothetical protein